MRMPDFDDPDDRHEEAEQSSPSDMGQPPDLACEQQQQLPWEQQQQQQHSSSHHSARCKRTPRQRQANEDERVPPASRNPDEPAFWIESINASGWQGAKDLVLDAGPEVRAVFVQEHKIADATEASAALSRMGWHSAWTPAVRGEGGGWSAGTAVLVRHVHGVRAVLPIYEGRAVACLVDVEQGRTMCLAAVYGKTGEGPNGSTNQGLHERLRQLASDMEEQQIPLIMGGDWNLEPTTLCKLPWVRHHKLHMVYEGLQQKTCKLPGKKGKLLDYFVVSSNAVATVASTCVRRDVPMTPHSPVRLVLAKEWAQQFTQGLGAAQPLPKDRLIGPPLPPPCYAEARKRALQARKMAAHSTSRREVGRAMFFATKLWAQQAAQEIAGKAVGTQQMQPSLYGQTPKLRQRRVVPKCSPGLTSRLRRAYDQRWCREVVAQLRSLAGSSSSSSSSNSRQEDPTAQQNAEEASSIAAASAQRVQQTAEGEAGGERQLLIKVGEVATAIAQAWCSGRGGATAEALLAQLHEDIPAYDEASAPDDSVEAAREAGWRSWATEATIGGASKGHAWTKLPEHWRPTVVTTQEGPTSAPQAVAHSQEQAFKTKWGASHTAVEARPLPKPCDRTALARLSPAQLREVSSSFPKKTAFGTDGFHVTHYAWLGDEALETLSTLFQAMEYSRRPPAQWMTMKTPLLPKKEAGKFRAIAVMTSAMRIWGRARRDICDEWEAKHDRAYFAAGAGRRPLAAVWRAALRAERGGQEARGQVCGMVCHDLESFYDNIQHDELRRAAKKHGMSETLLDTALALYTGPRFLAVDGFGASGYLYSDRGVMAGCSCCTTWAKLATIDPMDSVTEQWPNDKVEIDIYIDDVAMRATGSREQVPRWLGQATATLIEEMGQRGIPLADGKTAVAASDASVGRQLCGAMGVPLGEDKGRRLTFLGGDFAAGLARRQWQRTSAARKRRRAMAARTSRVARLRRAGGGHQTRTIVVAGLLPQGTYAAEVHGLSDGEWRQARFAGLAASGGTGNGQSWRRRLLIEGDASTSAMCSPLVAWTAELWAAQAGRPGAIHLGELLASWQAGERRNVQRWSSARGPVDAVRLTMRRLSWEWDGPWRWRDDMGATLDLMILSPAMVKQLAAAAARRALERQVGERLRAQGWQGATGAMSAAAIQRTLNSKDLNSKEKGSLRSLVSGSLWTQTRLDAGGYDTSRLCPLCEQAEDTVHHRLWYCRATDDLRQDKQELTSKARAAGPDSAIFNLGGLIVTPADDKPKACDAQLSVMDTETIFLADRGTVFIDGSASTQGIPELRRAAWAAVQIDDHTGEEVTSIQGTVPAAWPQTAQAAEHCAMLEAATRAAPTTVFVGDCAGVVNECRRLQTRRGTRAWERMSYGGVWRRASQSQAVPALAAMLKVAAHQAWQHMEDSIAKARARGNDRADQLAKQALKFHRQWAKTEYDEVDRQWEQALAIATLSGQAIARWPKAKRSERRQRTVQEQEATAARRETRMAAREEQRRQTMHSQAAAAETHLWSDWRGHLRCIHCGTSKHGAAAKLPCPDEQPKVCTIADKARDQGHVKLLAAAVLAPSGHCASALVICGHCGAFSQGRHTSSRLDGPCIPTKSGAYMLDRVRRGRHPRWKDHSVSGLAPLQHADADEESST